MEGNAHLCEMTGEESNGDTVQLRTLLELAEDPEAVNHSQAVKAMQSKVSIYHVLMFLVRTYMENNVSEEVKQQHKNEHMILQQAKKRSLGRACMSERFYKVGGFTFDEYFKRLQEQGQRTNTGSAALLIQDAQASSPIGSDSGESCHEDSDKDEQAIMREFQRQRRAIDEICDGITQDVDTDLDGAIASACVGQSGDDRFHELDDSKYSDSDGDDGGDY